MTARAPGLRRVPSLGWRHDRGPRTGERALAEEVPIAFAYHGCSYAVMMATPGDLTDFAYGFSLTEGVISAPADIEDLRVRPAEGGLVVNMTLAPDRRDAFWERRRYLAGPVGCGLCGLDSIAQVMRPCRTVTAELQVSPGQVADAVAALPRQQPLNRETRAAHAAAFWRRDVGLVAIREDVGRHNALDKLIGALLRQQIEPAEGMIVLTSRISVELVQKTAAAGAPVLVAVSAPTALAVSTANAAGITLIGIARDDGFEVLTYPHRVALSTPGSRKPDVCVA
ncbi:MAG: formate dehydrogenase accessory sulfurtransferase FdhD [Alphaproteobacteria bacterium]|nr:formate dehydrogenase accessory sulfurtransferase FdhD [Alphaproteobacteria bacterium]